MTLPTLIAERWYEHGQIDIGTDKCIYMEVLPAGAMVAKNSMFFFCAGRSGIDFYNVAKVDLSGWVFPLHGDLATETQTSLADMMSNVYDKYVPKVEDADPLGTAYSFGREGNDDADATIGDADSSLMFQPGKFGLGTFRDDPARPKCIYNRRFWMGLPHGNAIPVRNSDKYYYFMRQPIMLKQDIYASTDTYIMWVVTNPADFAADAWQESELFPADNEFYRLSFLDGRPNEIIPGAPINRGSPSMQDYQRWAMQYYVEKGDGERQWKQDKLMAHVMAYPWFDRTGRAPSVIAPNPAPNP